MKTHKLKMLLGAMVLGLASLNTSYAADTIKVTSSFDSGNIAVIMDNGSILLPAVPDTPLDIVPGTLLTFTPIPSGYAVTNQSGQSLLPFSAVPANNLFFDSAGSGADPDDGFQTVPLATPLSFFGIAYNTIYVTSDGQVTFGSGQGSSAARNYLRLVYNQPTIAPLLTDLAPDSDRPGVPTSVPICTSPGVPAGCVASKTSYDQNRCKGKVYLQDDGTKVIVTWDGVVHYQRISGLQQNVVCPSPATITNTFQLVLYRTGVIEMRYGSLDLALIGNPASANQEAVIGLAAGGGAVPFSLVDFSALTTTAQNFAAGAIFQEFTRSRVAGYDQVQLAREFYKTHGDKFNILAVAGNIRAIGLGPTLPPQRTTTGLGNQGVLAVRDETAFWGSQGKLRQMIGLGNIKTWVDMNVQEMSNPHLVKKACYNIDKTIPTDNDLNALLCLPDYNNQTSFAPYGFVDDSSEGHGLSRNLYEIAFITPETSTDPLQLIIGTEYSLGSRMAAFASGILGYYESSLRAGNDPIRRTDLRINVGTNFNFFYNNKVPSSQFPDGIPRVGSRGSHGSVIVPVALSGNPKKVIDLNNPGRTIADPVNAVSAAIAQCDAMGLATFMTEREYFIDGYSELEQYIMGLRNPEQIANSFAVSPAVSPTTGAVLDGFAPSFPISFRRLFPADDLTYCGTRRDINFMNDMINQPQSAFSNGQNGLYTGRRAPAIGDEQDSYANGSSITGGQNVNLCSASQASNPARNQARCVDVKTIAYILVVPANSTLDKKDLEILDNHRQAWEAYGNGPAVGGIGARGCQSGFSGVKNQCYNPFVGGLVPVNINKGATDDYIPKFDTSLNPKIF